MTVTANRVDAIFEEERTAGNALLMPFITGGFPSLEATRAVLPALRQAGARIVEIGFPFSDPIADGPVIAASMHDALLQGTTPDDIFRVCRQVADGAEGPDSLPAMIAMASISLIRAAGDESFVVRARDAGIDGLIVPDADIAEAAALKTLCDAHGMSLSLLVSPTTTADRARRITACCSGFVYLLARAGITGESSAMPQIKGRVAELRTMTNLPIAVGFGISTAEHVAAVTACADAAIVGSALVRGMNESRGRSVDAAGDLVRSLACGLRRGAPPET
jgi:tryptophan synthase alpha chain